MERKPAPQMFETTQDGTGILRDSRSLGNSLTDQSVTETVVELGQPNPAPTRAPHRILVVDDSHDTADSMAILLRLQGYEVQTAYDGPSAIAAVDAFDPEAILLDIGMPGQNGYKVCRFIRAHSSRTDLFVVAVTGWGRQEDVARCEDAGFDLHMTKPINHQELANVLARLPARSSTEVAG